ncbi:hypothetical protein E2320_009297, partial [Naja naja]
MEPEALRDLRALLERAGGRQPLRLAGEARPAELQTFARDLFAEPPPEEEEEEGETETEAVAAGRRRRARVRSGCGGRHPWRGCALLFALFRPASLEQPREMRRLREILRDLRAQLPAAPPPAVVGVVLLLQPPQNPEASEAARLQLEELLRRVFSSPRRRRRRRRDAGLPDTLQAVAYRPGDGRAAREAACRALRAALKLRAEARKDAGLFPFSILVSWGTKKAFAHQGAYFLCKSLLRLTIQRSTVVSQVVMETIQQKRQRNHHSCQIQPSLSYLTGLLHSGIPVRRVGNLDAWTEKRNNCSCFERKKNPLYSLPEY